MTVKNFRIATYNIHKCKGLDLRTSPARIIKVLREIDADIIALQEVVAHENRQIEDNQAKFIADALGFSYFLGENRKHLGSPYGNAILSRFPVRQSENFDITIEKKEPRGCLFAEIEVAENSLVQIYNVHLGTSFFERRKQGKLLLDKALAYQREDVPRIMLGDFNEYTNGLASKTLKNHFQSEDLRKHLSNKRSYPGIFPILHLDHIYYDGNLAIKKAVLHRSKTSLIASDHLPLYADFVI